MVRYYSIVPDLCFFRFLSSFATPVYLFKCTAAYFPTVLLTKSFFLVSLLHTFSIKSVSWGSPIVLNMQGKCKCNKYLCMMVAFWNIFELSLCPVTRSFYQPWADHATERTDLEKIDESHACQKLLVIISGVLRKNASDNELLSLQELESSGLFERERTNLQKG